MIDDYNVYKSAVRSLCDEFDEYVLLPGESKHLALVRSPPREGDTASMEIEWPLANGERDRFLLPESDVLVLPVENITLESLAKLFTERLLAGHAATMRGHGVAGLTVRVSSGPGQAASYGAAP